MVQRSVGVLFVSFTNWSYPVKQLMLKRSNLEKFFGYHLKVKLAYFYLTRVLYS